MKFIHSKEGLRKALIISKRNIILTMTVLGLLATIASPIHARNRSKKSGLETSRRRDRDRKAGTAAAVLTGAGAGGLAVGLASRSKWAPLGVVGGAIAGYLLIRAIRKNRKGRVSHTQKIQTKGRRHVRQQEQMDYEPDQQQAKSEKY